MVSAAIFIPLVIIGLTQGIKYLAPNIKGLLTIVIAIVVGIVIALIDQTIGVINISIAEGVIYALEAIGVTTALSKTSTAPQAKAPQSN